MRFQIEACDPALFASLFDLPDDELAKANICKQIVAAKPGSPCRVSLADAEVGETVLLLNYEHQPTSSPFRSSHAIYVREGAVRAHPAVGEVPEVMLSRLISIRGFDDVHMMIHADVVPGADLGTALDVTLADPKVAYIHLHYAKLGCFAACVRRV